MNRCFVAPLATLVISYSFVISGCSQQPSIQSQGKTVEVPETAIKSQNRIGFCWAYATTGFIESLMLKKSGQSVDLSEEALGFYRMAEELMSLKQRFKPEELATKELVSKKVFEGLEGWDLMFNPAYNPGFRARGSLQLIHDYGVVPESAWSFKFLKDEQTDAFFDYIFTAYADLVKAQGENKITSEMVFDLLANPKAYGSRPPTSFNYVAPDGQSRSVTAQQFALDIIGFSPDDYTYMIPDAQIKSDDLISAVKLTLARGINVPLSYTIYKDATNSWDASYSAAKLDPAHLEAQGGHAVLISDFVNKGGRPGHVSSSELLAELSKAPSELDYVVIKNSWSTMPQSPILRLPGYFTMDQSYIQLLANKNTDIALVIPRDIAFQIRYKQ